MYVYPKIFEEYKIAMYKYSDHLRQIHDLQELQMHKDDQLLYEFVDDDGVNGDKGSTWLANVNYNEALNLIIKAIPTHPKDKLYYWEK